MMKYSQLLPFIAILISLAVSAQQPNYRFQSSILKHSSHCTQRVTSDANIVLRYVTKVIESDGVIENKTIELKPGEMTVVKGLEHGIQGMCIGEIRRLIIPSTLHVSNDGQISDKAMIYDIEILQIDSKPLLTPVFWFILSVIGLSYTVFNNLAITMDKRKAH